MNLTVMSLMIVPYFVMGVLYLVVAFNLYKLVVSTRGGEVISRQNLARVKLIQYIFFALLVGKIGFTLLLTAVFTPSVVGLLLQLAAVIGSSWELLAGMLIIYILAIVFKRAVNLREEQALTI